MIYKIVVRKIAYVSADDPDEAKEAFWNDEAFDEEERITKVIPQEGGLDD